MLLFTFYEQYNIMNVAIVKIKMYEKSSFAIYYS